MKKKIAFIILLMTVFSLTMSAQTKRYGLFVGGSINMMNIDKSMYYDDSEPYTVMGYNHYTQDTNYTVSYLPVDGATVKPNGSILFGGFFEYMASDMVGLQFELLYNQYGYKLKGTVDQKNIADDQVNTYAYESNLKMSNFTAAVLVKIQPVRYFSIDLGVQPSYCFKMTKETQKGPFHKNHVYDSKNEYNTLNVGATGGFTAYWGDVFFAARYTLGLVDVLQKKTPYNDTSEGGDGVIKYTYDDVKSRTSSVQLTVGYRIR